MSNLFCFVDHEFTKVDNEIIPQELYEMGICVKDRNFLRFEAVGIIITKNRIFSILPKGMQVPQNLLEQQNKTRLLIDTLIRYSRLSDKGDFLKYGDNSSIEPLDAAHWLVQDYLQYGILQFQRKKEQINGKGKINWPKTIKETSSYIINNQPYYLDLVTHYFDTTTQNELSHIHMFVLQNISERYGWFFKFKIDFSPVEPKIKHSRMLYLIKKALNETFIDREIQLFKNLFHYLKGTSNLEKETISLYLTENFHLVWEKMCALLLGDNTKLRNMIPNPYWNVNGNIQRTAQIPDILIDDKENIFIFDAKYYRIHKGINKLPGWGDIVKQLFYSLSIRKSVIGNYKKVYNAFLFPSTVEKQFRRHGYASVEKLENTYDFGKIFSYELDIETLMRFYTNSQSNNLKDLLVTDLIACDERDNLTPC